MIQAGHWVGGQAEWREHYPEKIKSAIMQARTSNGDLARAVAEIDAAADAINALLSWPGERVAAAEHQRLESLQPASFSRRGSL